MKRRNVWWAIAGLVIIVYTLLPVLWILSLSFKTDSQDKHFFPAGWTWSNYGTVFNSGLFTSALRNSIGISVIATQIIGTQKQIVGTQQQEPGWTLR